MDAVKDNGSGIIPYNDQIVSLEKAKRLPYYWKLEIIRDTLERELVYAPKENCFFYSRIGFEVLGLPVLEGDYRPPHKDNEEPLWVDGEYSGFSRMHCWNFDEERGLYVDLTQDQFWEGVGKIVIMPATTKVLQKRNRIMFDVRPRFLHKSIRKVSENLKETLLKIQD